MPSENPSNQELLSADALLAVLSPYYPVPSFKSLPMVPKACQREQQEILSWEVLPADVLLCVLRELDVLSVRSCVLVCKHWKAVSDSPCLWRAFLSGVCGGEEVVGMGEDVKEAAVKALTSRLYTWGGKVLEVPGTTLRNRLTCPTLVTGGLVGGNQRGNKVLPEGHEFTRNHSEVREVAAGEDFCALLSWGGGVCDTRMLEGGALRGYRPGWTTFVDWWVPPGAVITRIAAGGGTGTSLGGHVLAISSSGEVWGWGSNSLGQLGLDIEDGFVHFPEKVPAFGANSAIVGAACGKQHSVVWSEHGILYSCGDNSQGACAHPKCNQVIPAFLSVDLKDSRVLHAACSDSNTVICTKDGHVWVTGDNYRGQCGPLSCDSLNCFEFTWIDPSTAWKDASKNRAKDLCIKQEDVKIVEVAASSGSVYALTNAGGLYAWGSGSQGKLGTGGSCKVQVTPSRLPWSSKIKTIVGASGGRFAAAIDTYGRLYSWGEGKYGQLGHGDTNKRTIGRAVKSLYGCGVLSIACGSDFMMCVTVWKPSNNRSARMNPSGLSRSFTVSSLTSCGSLEEEMLASSGDGSFRYIEVEPMSSSLLSLSPSFPPSMSNWSRKAQRRWSLGRDLAAINIEQSVPMPEDYLYEDLGNSPDLAGPENPLYHTEQQSRNSRSQPRRRTGGVADREGIPVSGNSGGANPPSQAPRQGERSQDDAEVSIKAKKGKKRYAMWRRQIKAFANDPKSRELCFPPELSSSDRYKVHAAAEQFGVSHESFGVEPNRQIRVWKPLQPRLQARLPMHDFQCRTPEFDALTNFSLSTNSAKAIFEDTMEV